MDKNNLPSEKNGLNQENPAPVIKAYTIRWLILLIYITYATISSAQWVEYSIISNLVMKYYSVSASAVDWTAVVFMIMWPILVFPASFIIDKKGLRVAALIGCSATAIGAVIKIFSVGTNLFYVVILGQTATAVSQIFILSLPPKIAVTWFKTDEVSVVCSLGVLGMQLGSALGFVLPPIIVKDHDVIEDIGSDLNILCYIYAGAIIPVTLIVFFYFPKQPNHAPSQAQVYERENKEEVTISTFIGSLKALIKNKPFLVHTVAYGICVGIFSAVGTLLNQFVLNYFEGAQEDAGRMGLVMIIVGMVGSLLTGFILDKTHMYKETAFTIFLFCAVGMGGFLFTLEIQSKWMAYLGISVLGFFLNAYMPAGIEFATEITYPSPESTTTGILLATSQMMAMIFTIGLSEVNMTFGTLWAMYAQVGILLVGTGLTFLTPNKLRRQEAFRKDIGFEQVSVNDV